MTENGDLKQDKVAVGSGPAGTLVRRHRKVGIVMAVIPVLMLGMAYAAVPLYQMFCQVTGYGGTTRVAFSAPNQVLDRSISIRFDGNVAEGLSWTFKPAKHKMDVRIGEVRVATYTATNTSGKVLTGTAAFNVTPESAGLYFNKIECFCFTRQVLQPGETAELPVSFFVDPEIMDDYNTKHLSEITLSYTFFPQDEDGSTVKQVAREGGRPPGG